MMRKGLSSLLVAATLVGAFGCRPHAEPERRAQLGIFFGGQIQERDEIPFTLDRAKQTQGFRIDFGRPLSASAKIRWEVDRPRVRGPGRATELGQAEARVGQERFDQEIRFEPGQPLGTWNFRVLVEDDLVIDRPVLVYDARARRRAIREAEKSVAEN